MNPPASCVNRSFIYQAPAGFRYFHFSSGFVTFERNVVFQVDYGIETTSENQRVVLARQLG